MLSAFMKSWCAQFLFLRLFRPRTAIPSTPMSSIFFSLSVKAAFSFSNSYFRLATFYSPWSRKRLFYAEHYLSDFPHCHDFYSPFWVVPLSCATLEISQINSNWYYHFLLPSRFDLWSLPMLNRRHCWNTNIGGQSCLPSCSYHGSIDSNLGKWVLWRLSFLAIAISRLFTKWIGDSMSSHPHLPFTVDE